MIGGDLFKRRVLLQDPPLGIGVPLADQQDMPCPNLGQGTLKITGALPVVGGDRLFVDDRLLAGEFGVEQGGDQQVAARPFQQSLETRLPMQVAAQRLLVEQFLLHPGVDQAGPFTVDALGVDTQGQLRLQIRLGEGDIAHPGDRLFGCGGFFAPGQQQGQTQCDVGDATHI